MTLVNLDNQRFQPSLFEAGDILVIISHFYGLKTLFFLARWAGPTAYETPQVFRYGLVFFHCQRYISTPKPSGTQT